MLQREIDILGDACLAPPMAAPLAAPLGDAPVAPSASMESLRFHSCVIGARDEAELFADGIDELDFCSMLLAGLATMASKSKRRQADLDAVLRRTGLRASPDRIKAALRHLETTACIREIVPLYDGGLLLTVTNLGMDTLGRASDWRFLQQLVLATH